MKNILLYLWQLPQNLLGLLVILVTGARYNDIDYRIENNYWLSRKYNFGISLGNYIIFGGIVGVQDVKHEQGHCKQSLYLGWLYLIVVGVPSIVRNIWDRVAHKGWSHHEKDAWYYGHYPEDWADKLGGVNRF